MPLDCIARLNSGIRVGGRSDLGRATIGRSLGTAKRAIHLQTPAVAFRLVRKEVCDSQSRRIHWLVTTHIGCRIRGYRASLRNGPNCRPRIDVRSDRGHRSVAPDPQ
jgi:hypothetical protein